MPLPKTKCFVAGCTGNLPEHNKLYSFPSNPEQRDQWIAFCGRPAEELSNKHGVCRVHFTEDDFLPTQRLLDVPPLKWKLARSVVPSLNGPGYAAPLTLIEINNDGDFNVEEEVPMDEDEMIILEGVEEDGEGQTTAEEVSANKLCRLCLSVIEEGDVGARSLFQCPPGQIDLQVVLRDSFQLLIDSKADWPELACSSCVSSLEAICAFKGQIVASHAQLYTAMAEKAAAAEVARVRTTTAAQEDAPGEEAGGKAEGGEDRYGPKTFKQMTAFARETKLLQCPECAQSVQYLSFRSYARHLQQEHCTQPYLVCCGQRLGFNTPALDHLRRHVEEDQKKCVPCQLTFRTRKAKQEHVQDAHPRERPTEFPCNECGKVFRQMRHLVHHKRTHLAKEQRGSQCSYCGQRFTEDSGLRRHINRMHEVEVRIVCDKCAKPFADRSNYYQHRKHCRGPEVEKERLEGGGVRKGPGGRPRMDATKLQHKAVEDMAEPVNCPICEEVVDRVDMRVHSLLHVTVKIHRYCEICMIRVSGTSNFKTHMDRHMGRRYQCEFCPGVEYDNHQGHYLHMKTKHTEVFEERKAQRLATLKAD